MQENLKDILNHLSADIDEETLLQYLQGNLSAEQQHEVEKQMLDNDFAADALEGLRKIKDQQRIHFLVEQLNRDLTKKTIKKKAYKERLHLKTDPWLLTAALIILLLVIISFIVIHRHLLP
jgi:predicted secreted protein